MTIEDTKEIIGIVRKSKWNSVREFLKKIISQTLDQKIGYILVAFDVRVKGSKKLELSDIIKNPDQINILDKIQDFSMMSLYQTDGLIHNHLNITKDDEVIIVIAKYLGGNIKYSGLFDFSIQIDSFNNPFFTNASGKTINCADIINLVNPNITEHTMINEKKKIDLDLFVFEKFSGKKAIWGVKETNSFTKWKKNAEKEYKKLFGERKIAYREGKITKDFKIFLEGFLDGRKISEILLKRLFKNK